MTHTNEIEIIAVVKMNDEEAYVLNRMPVFKYRKLDGGHLIASDGPFSQAYKFEMPRDGFKAFAGREFAIPMADGTEIKAFGQYWHTGVYGFRDIAIGTVDSLLKCYVFSSCNVDPDIMAALRADYNGCVYPYREYEAVIDYAPQRMKLCKEIWKLEADKAALIKHVKAAHRTIEALK